MRNTWGLFAANNSTCGPGGGNFAPELIVSLIGSARENKIATRVRLQYFLTIIRLIEFVERTRALSDVLSWIHDHQKPSSSLTCVAGGWLIVNGAGELANLTEACRFYKRQPTCVTIGVLPWGALADDEARRLVCALPISYAIRTLVYCTLCARITFVVLIVYVCKLCMYVRSMYEYVNYISSAWYEFWVRTLHSNSSRFHSLCPCGVIFIWRRRWEMLLTVSVCQLRN